MRIAVALLLLVALAACGGESSSTDLSIEVSNGASTAEYELRCGPPSGNVPQPGELCEVLDKNAEVMLFPPETGQACGAVSFLVFKITGRFEGEAVDAVASSCYGHAEAERLWSSQLPAEVGG